MEKVTSLEIPAGNWRMRDSREFPQFPVACEIPTVKFRRGHPQQGRQIEVDIPKICEFQPVFQKYRYRYRIPKRHEKIPTKIPNTDSKYRYRPSSSALNLFFLPCNTMQARYTVCYEILSIILVDCIEIFH